MEQELDPLSSKRKFKALSELLEQEYVLVHLLTGAEGVCLPDYLKSGPNVTLKISRWFRGGMDITEERICADLLFNGSYFTCFIPLPAIWGATSAKGENIIWPDSMPPEAFAALAMSVGQAAPEQSPKAVTKLQTAKALQVAQPETAEDDTEAHEPTSTQKETSETDAKEKDPSDGSKKRPSYLRRVK